MVTYLEEIYIYAILIYLEFSINAFKLNKLQLVCAHSKILCSFLSYNNTDFIITKQKLN